LDYIDANESEGALIEFSAGKPTTPAQEGVAKIEVGSPATHREIHESFIFGMMANLICLPENNPAARNSFSCGQSKQACSLYHTNHQVRMDKTAVVLVNGQVPLVKTRYLEHINHEENTYGENAIVAIMCYTGYNVEDAVLFNEGSLKRGLFRTTYYTTYEAHEEKSKTGGATIDKVFTNIESEANVVGTKPGYDYSKLDKYGLIRENTPIDDKTVLVGITSSGSDNKDNKVDGSKTPKKGQLGTVDKAFITDGEEGFRIAKIRIREERIPNLGDKMASRVGQKGTVGLIIPECDMPFTKDGIRPDMIINPHAIPTRMTIGQLVESITGKACLHYGGFGDCTAFNNDGSKIKVFGEMLTNAGYHSSGNDILYNGMTGEQLETEIFMGPTYYMRLKHMVKDKINYRAQGPRTALTRQPVSGRANDGGLRIGEMERDAVISHGASSFLRESMMERGDKYFMAVCNTTGMIAIYNPNKNLFISPAADGPLKFTGSLDSQDIRVENVTKFGRDFSVICIPYSFKLLMQELQTINMQMRLITEDNIEQLENLSYSRNIEKLTYVDKFDSKTYIRQVNDIQMKANIVKEFSGKNVPEDEAKWKVLEENAASPYVLPDTPPTYSPPFSPASPPSAPVPPPFSPGSPIPEESSAESESDILSEKAQLYKGGDAVHLHGDSVPNRVWSVFSVGDRMLTIDTNNYEMLGGGNESRKVVTAAEVYPISDYSFAQGSFPMAPMVPNPNTMMGGSDMMMQPQQMMTGGMPAINFAPTFKIMNGGNDFSTEPTNEAIVGNGESTISNNINALSPQQPAMTGGTTATEQKTEPKSLDFSSFLIKKLGM
jgi:hypothetical protein